MGAREREIHQEAVGVRLPDVGLEGAALRLVVRLHQSSDRVTRSRAPSVRGRAPCARAGRAPRRPRAWSRDRSRRRACARCGPVLLLEAEDHLERLAPASGGERQQDRLAVELDALEARRARPGTPPATLVTVDDVRGGSVSVRAPASRADLERFADVLHRDAVEHQLRRGPRTSLRVVPLDEAVDQLGGRHRSARRGRVLGRAQPLAAAVQRRLDRAGRGGEHRGDLLESHVEDLLQHDRGALLRREPLQQPRARVAQVARRGGRRTRFRRVVGAAGGRRAPRGRGAAARRSRRSSPCAAGRRAGCGSRGAAGPSARTPAAACPGPGPRRPRGCPSGGGSSRGAPAAAARSGRRSDARPSRRSSCSASGVCRCSMSPSWANPTLTPS